MFVLMETPERTRKTQKQLKNVQNKPKTKNSAPPSFHNVERKIERNEPQT